jgi:hypothetical protein
LILDDQNALAHAGSTCRSTMTGSVKVNVEPWPGCDATQILPPCITPTILRRIELAGCIGTPQLTACLARA